MAEKIALQSIKTKPWEEIRFYSRRLSQEFPIIDTSFDVYYREKSVGVPFLWESQPGTPKIRTREFQVPPLTPPPSFHASPKPTRKQRLKNQARFEYGSLWSGSRVSSPPRLSYDDCESPVSTLCFRGGARGRSRGCSSGIIRLLLGD